MEKSMRFFSVHVEKSTVHAKPLANGKGMFYKKSGRRQKRWTNGILELQENMLSLQTSKRTIQLSSVKECCMH